MKKCFLLVATFVTAALLTACGGDHKDHAHKDHDHKDHNHKDHDHDDSGHVHEAPRGGTLVELGDHEANVELVLDEDRKVFALYVLDAHAENAAKIAQPEVELTILASKAAAKDKAENDFTLKLAAVANENTGEKVGDTSQFEISSDALKGLSAFDGIIKSITIKGATYTDVKFSFKPTAKK